MLFGRTKGLRALAEYYKHGGPETAATVLQNNRTVPATGLSVEAIINTE